MQNTRWLQKHWTGFPITPRFDLTIKIVWTDFLYCILLVISRLYHKFQRTNYVVLRQNQPLPR